MTTETVTTERYVVRKGMHLGALRREIRVDDILEWQPETETFLRINGTRIERSLGVEPGEGMRQLRGLNTKDPDHPAIELLEMAQGGASATKLGTSTLCVLPILGCLAAAAAHLEGDRGTSSELTPVTEQQREFMEMFEDLFPRLPSIPELEDIADNDVKVVNAWLKDKGFDIQLPPPTDGFAVASVLDVLLKWLNEGKKTTITGVTAQEYPGVRIDGGVTVAHVAAVHPYPVVRVATQSTDVVCMSMVDEVPEGVAGLFLKVADLEKVKAASHTYKGVCFPMVNLDVQPDISWIEGFEVGAGFFIEVAKQQTKFRMNEKGARVQSAAAMTVSRGISTTRPHIIDRPFILWVKREGLEFPLFAALLCEDVWKAPEEL